VGAKLTLTFNVDPSGENPSGVPPLAVFFRDSQIIPCHPGSCVITSFITYNALS
jgi:hypothetical protein